MQNQFHLSSLVWSIVHAENMQTWNSKPEDMEQQTRSFVNLRQSSSSGGKRKRSTQHNQICSQTYPTTNARNVRARGLTGRVDADVISFCAIYQTLISITNTRSG
nr:hypothetical protein [Tanacetum cinerariifolium]